MDQQTVYPAFDTMTNDVLYVQNSGPFFLFPKLLSRWFRFVASTLPVAVLEKKNVSHHRPTARPLLPQVYARENVTLCTTVDVSM